MSIPLYDIARNSCQEWVMTSSQQQLPTRIDAVAIDEYARNVVDVDTVRTLGSSLAQDANCTRVDAGFASVEAEAALIVLLHALDFGGGWRLALHAHTGGKGAFLTVKAGVEKLYNISASDSDTLTLSAEWLETRTLEDIGEYFSLPTNKGKELRPFAIQLTKVINEVGAGVKKAGASTVEEWLVARLRESNNSSSDNKEPTPAGDLVHALVHTFPFTFNDVHKLEDGTVVSFYKKAQLVVGELYHRFRQEDERFDFCDGPRLTAFIDNVICAVCRKLGLIVVTDELKDAIESNQFLPSSSLEEVSLRAASMVAIERIVAALDGSLSPCELGNYFWGVLGKTPEFRKYTRHATRDTVFY